MSEIKEETFYDKLLNIDERIIYVILFFILAIPLLYPIGLPLVITEQPMATFDYIENMEPGSIVVYGYDASAITYMDQGPAAKAILRHLLLQDDVKVIGLTIGPEGEQFWERDIVDVAPPGKEYGEDYVWLGFIAGYETGVASALANPEKTFGGKDAYGNNFADLELMGEFNSGEDVDLFVTMSLGANGFFAWLRQAADKYNKDFIVAPLGGEAGTYASFLASGQVNSWVAGTRQAAEYQLLLQQGYGITPGPVVATMDAQSIGHLFSMALIIFTNLVFLIKRFSGGNE
jgi:hypothetical protein